MTFMHVKNRILCAVLQQSKKESGNPSADMPDVLKGH